MNTTQQTTNEVKEFLIFGKVLTSGMDRSKVIKVLRTIPGVIVDAPRLNRAGFSKGYGVVKAKNGTYDGSNEEYEFSYRDGVLDEVEYRKLIRSTPYKCPQRLEMEADWK